MLASHPLYFILRVILTRSWLQTFNSLVYTRIWRGVSKQCMLKLSLAEPPWSKHSHRVHEDNSCQLSWKIFHGGVSLSPSSQPDKMDMICLPACATAWNSCMPKRWLFPAPSFHTSCVQGGQISKELSLSLRWARPRRELRNIKDSFPACCHPARTWSLHSPGMMVWLF